MSHALVITLMFAVAVLLIIGVLVSWSFHQRAMRRRHSPKLGLANVRFLALLALICAACAVVFAYVVHSERERAVAAYQELELNDARQIAQNLERQIQLVQAQTQVIARSISNQAFDWETKSMFRKTFRLMDNRWVRGLSLVSAEGRILFSVPDESLIGSDVSTQTHNSEFIKHPRSLISDPFFCLQGYQAIAVMEPYNRNNRLVGWVTALVDFNSLLACYIKPGATARLTQAGLMDRNGRILADLNPNTPPRAVFDVARSDPAHAEAARQMLRDESGMFRYVSDYNRDGSRAQKVARAGAFARVNLGGGNFWVTGVAAGESAILAHFPAVRWPQLLVFLLFAALLALAAIERLRAEREYAAKLEREIAAAVEAQCQAEQAQRQLEAQLRQSQKMEAVGKLAGGVAHDFNNVLTAIIGNLQLAQLRAGPGIQKYLGDALTASGRATEMVRQLLTFSRKSSGVREPVNLNALACETACLVEKSIDRRIHLTTVMDESLPQVKADPNQIHQVIMNLCVNARDAILERIRSQAAPSGGEGQGHSYQITLQTRVEQIDEEYCRASAFAHPGRFAVLIVGDEGIGMDAETLARIFEPFFTTKADGEGTGLGLSTVYGIVKSHNGWVHVASEPGCGAIFKVYLPIAAPPEIPNTAAVVA